MDYRALGFEFPKMFDPRIIRLTKGRFAIVDGLDFELVNQHSWNAQKRGNSYYAHRTINLGHRRFASTEMHRQIMNAQKGRDIDHKNHNGLDNTRQNLRHCTGSQNCQNRRHGWGSSRFKGVSWHKLKNKWQSRIRVNQKDLILGTFDDEVEAAKAYNEAAQKHFGEFACLNKFPF